MLALVGWAMVGVLFVCTTAEFDTIEKEARAGNAEGRGSQGDGRGGSHGEGRGGT